MKILYELTYATRGQSGIPRDTKTVAQALAKDTGIEVDFLLNPRGYTRKRKAFGENSKWMSSELGDALRREPGRSMIPPRAVSILILLQSIYSRPNLPKIKLDIMQKMNVYDFLGLQFQKSEARKNEIYLLSISYLARFARPGFLGVFKVKTSNYDFFIQQQLDPIKVSKQTKHIVRLHDFLPISHPQFFDSNAVRIFSKSLRLMLRGNKKIWVMDSHQTAEDFKTYFGQELNVHVIPCVVNANQVNPQEGKLQKNQICMVNTIEPRKRVHLAIAGFRQAKELGLITEDWEFVIVGNEGWQESLLVGKLRKQLFGTDIKFVEGPPDFELQRIFKQSKIVISTSVAEGFGLPPLEGMASGCLPVISDIPQHRETVGNFGFYFGGDDQRM